MISEQKTRYILRSELEIPEFVDYRIERTLSDIKAYSGNDASGVRTHRRAWVRSPRSRAIIAASLAIITALVLTTAFAYGETIVEKIRQIVFGDSSVSMVYDPQNSSVEVDIGENGMAIRTNAENTFEIVDRSVEPGTDSLSMKVESGNFERFSNVEEANIEAPFTIMEPSILPENAKLSKVLVYRYPDGTLSYDAMLLYIIDYEIFDAAGEVIGLGGGGITLIQRYGGPDAYIDGTVLYPFTVEKGIVGDNEAIIVNTNMPELLDMESDFGGDFIKVISMTIVWLKNGVCYELSASLPDYVCDKDMLLAIAESIG